MNFNFNKCIIYVSFPLLAMLTLFLWIGNNNFVIYSVLAATLHESGHIFAMIAKKHKPKQVNLRIFSIDIIDTNRISRDYNRDIFILLSGPLTNLIFGDIAFVVYKLFDVASCLIFAYANLFLALLNLLPIESLDGGQILFNLLLRRFKLQTAEKISFSFSVVTLLPLAILGFYVLLLSKYNFSLLILSCYLIGGLLFKKKSFYY